MKPRIVLIGPVLPFRGGIAQHTTMLHRALSGRADLLTISFSRQYPAWLFPGASDTDPAYDDYSEPAVRYMIDSINPLTWRSAAGVIREFTPDTVIIPWWTVFWTFCFHYIARAVRRSDARMVFLCHNVIEHESAFWKRQLTAWVLGTTDQFLVHTHADRTNLIKLLPNAQVRVYPHPIYDQFPKATETLPRRAALELLFYGFIRPYKGLDILLEALALVPDLDVMLTVAGEFWDGEAKTRARIHELGLEHRVELRPRYHTEQETAQLFERADFVILPYRSATGTGVVPIAYHYNKPVVVTGVGGLPDVVDDNRTGFIVSPESPQDLAGALRRCVGFKPDQESFAQAKQCMSWDGLAAALMAP